MACGYGLLVCMQVQPVLDTTYSELVLNIIESKKELKHLEEQLLNTLKESEGIKWFCTIIYLIFVLQIFWTMKSC